MRIARDGFELRPWRRGDEESLVRHADDERIARNLRDVFPHPYTREDAERWLALALGDDATEIRLAIDVAGEAVGGIGLEPQADVYRRTAKIGYWLGAAFWGRGIATAAVGALTDHALAELGFLRIEAGVYAWNPASCRVLEKAGYVLEGRLRSAVVKAGAVTDVLLYARVGDS